MAKQKTDFYLTENIGLSNVQIDQTIIINERHLKKVLGFGDSSEESFPSLNSDDEWYPYVNSYYPFTEDVDALGRVNHLLGSETSLLHSSSTSSEIPAREEFPYSERDAQLQYLLSTPLSFIILGKPEIGEKELGKKIAEYWKCVYIEPEILIEEEIKSGSKVGQCIEFNLKCGRAVGIDVILRLVEKRVNAETAKHRGIIICGFPLIANDLYLEDPVTTMSAVFNATQVFSDTLRNTFDIIHATDASRSKSGVVSEDDSEENDFHALEMEIQDKRQLRNASAISLDVGTDTDIQFLPEISTDYEVQLNFLFSLIKDPFLVIHMMCCTEDVIQKRKNSVFSIYSKIEFQVIPEHQFGGYDPAESYGLIDFLGKWHSVKMPRNFPANVSTQLDNYHNAALNFIEKRILLHNPEYFLKVDARNDIENIFEVVKLKLLTLPHQKTVVPGLLHSINLEFDAGEDVSEPDLIRKIDYVKYFKLYSIQETSGQFKWTWSQWGTKCPVSMKESVCKQGDVEYAVHFMNKIFFLANEDALLKFYRNPRPYLLPLELKPLCKIFIFGPKASGKTTVAQCISYLLDGRILSPNEMFDNIIHKKEGEEKEKIRQAAVEEAKAILTRQRAEEAKILEEERIQKIKDWLAEITSVIEEVMVLLEEQRKEELVTKFEISSFPMAMKTISMAEIETETTIAIRKKRDYLESFQIPFSKEPAVLEGFKDPRKLVYYLPDKLKKRIRPLPVSSKDPFVIGYAHEAVANVTLGNVDVFSENFLEYFVGTIKECEVDYIRKGKNKGGWIMDDMICDVKFLEELYPEHIADDIIILKDSSDNFQFLVDRYEKGKIDFKDFREVFLNLRKNDVQFPLYYSSSADSTKFTIVQNILLELIDRDEIYGSDPNVLKRSDSYRNKLNIFYEKWKDVNNYFLKIGKEPIEIDVANKTFPELLEEVILSVDNRYRLGARIFTQDDRAEEVRHFINQSAKPTPEMEDMTSENKLDDYRLYGDTSYYCPVTYFDKWVLWKGQEDLAAKFENKVYLLSSKDDLNKFLRTPHLFVSGKLPSRFPPPRVCVIGSPGVGKTTISRAISTNYGLSYVSFFDLLHNAYKLKCDSIFELLQNADGSPTVKDYFNNVESLPEKFYTNELSNLWFDHPMVNTGFVIDDFPKREADISMMVKHKLIPDMVIVLNVKDSILIESVVEKLCSNWTQKIQLEEIASTVKQTSNEYGEKRQKRFQELLEERRNQRFAMMKEDKEGVETDEEPDEVIASQVSFNSVEDQKDIDDINRLLDVELPEVLAVEQSTESIGQARKKFETQVPAVIRSENQIIDVLKTKCTTNNIPLAALAVDFDFLERTYRQVFYVVDPVGNRNRSFFENCYDITHDLAESLLSTGYFFLSRFGRLCPVQYQEKLNPFHMYLVAVEKDEIFPVIHRSFIYFIHGTKNLEKFKQDPLAFVTDLNVKFPCIPFVMAITGSPKCGKTDLAKKISQEFGLKVITRGQAVRDVLVKLPHCFLTKQMENVLRKGWNLTDEIVIKFVEAGCLDNLGPVQGVILDGFPNSIVEVRHLSYAGLVPNLVIDLRAEKDEILECFKQCSGKGIFPRFTNSFFDRILTEWNLTAEEFREWFRREYQITSDISISTSKWSVFEKAKQNIFTVLFGIKDYYNKAVDDYPVRLINMKVSPLEFLQRQSPYQSFCPCCLYFSDDLICGGDPPDRTGVVQYKKYFYWLCQDHINCFLNTPDKFLAPLAQNSVPADLPKELFGLKSVPENVAEDGYCVTCYKLHRNVQKGRCSFAVSYTNKIFLFDTEECLLKFMTKPQEYKFSIGFKTADKYPSLNYKNLPILGMLEQYIATPLIKAIQFISARRPLIPGLSIQASALIGVGLFLKTRYADISPECRTEYVEGAEKFRVRRKHLISYLDRMKTTINPYIYYQEPMPDFRMLESSRSESSYGTKNSYAGSRISF